jgi:hypothetical protein
VQNEYAKQIRELQSKDQNAHAKIFVQAVCIQGLDLPMPEQPTVCTLVLNNSVHYVTTPEFRLSPDVFLNQQFEL